MKKVDLIIIGGGPAGLAAGLAAKNAGVSDILIIERDPKLGGILNQCIHNGFGLHTFQEELSGPEYAHRFIKKVMDEKIPLLLNTMVIDLTPEKVVTVISRENGLKKIQGKSIILAMGCRERPRGALNIPGYRPAGIYSAGTAQRLVNMEGFMPGKEIVILGSGDIGLIMARRLTLEGAVVKCVSEVMAFSGGLKRNMVQCLQDFNIPLKLNHTITDIKGRERVEGITIAEVDENKKPRPGTEEYIPCDTLLLSVGLIPENELSLKMGVDLNQITGGPRVDESLETSIPGVFACGNVLHVHDLVDFVSEEASLAGKKAGLYLLGYLDTPKGDFINIKTAHGVRYTVPEVLNLNRMANSVKIRFRSTDVFLKSSVVVTFNGKEVSRKKKTIITPGEMEEVLISKEDLFPELTEITIKIEGKD